MNAEIVLGYNFEFLGYRMIMLAQQADAINALKRWRVVGLDPNTLKKIQPTILRIGVK